MGFHVRETDEIHISKIIMKTIFLLSAADKACLRDILNLATPGPKPTAEQNSALKKILSKSAKTADDANLANHVGIHDKVSLVSPQNPLDYFNLQIVPPAEANADNDLISLFLPVSLAILGRRNGEAVTFEGPEGPREMRIFSISKCEELAS